MSAATEGSPIHDHTIDDSDAHATYPSLKDKVVLISGGARGIGASMVAHFAMQGAKIAFCDMDTSRAELVCQYVEGRAGRRPLTAEVDLQDPAAGTKWLEEAASKLGAVDCLINNAGNDQARDVFDMDREFLDWNYEVNLRHQYLLAAAAAREMMSADGGSIINMGSISWMLGHPEVSAYTTMKAAISGMTKSLARELGANRIRVNSIAPGWVLTEKQQEKGERQPEKYEEYLSRQAWKTHLYPADVAKLALWLASDEASCMTGQTIVLDGGIV